VPQPDSVEARWSGHSMAFFIENLNGIERAFTADADGRVGPGIDSLLNYMDATVGDQNLAEAIITQIDEMRTRANALGSIPEAVRANRALVDELYRECLVLLKLLKVDVVTQLGVMITTLEGDGD
jgi:predicted lipoprotein